MALSAALFLAFVATATAAAAPAAPAPAQKESKADLKLQARQDRIVAGKKEVDQNVANMEDRHTHLTALSKNDAQLDQLASEIELRVQPTLTDAQRKSTEEDYEKQLDNMRSSGNDSQAVAGYEAAVKKNLDKLSDADRQDARNLRKEFKQARRGAEGEVKNMAKATHKSLHKMGGATGLEMAEERAGKHNYDHAEHQLEHEKDMYNDRVDDLVDQLEDTLESIYSKVEDRVEKKAGALEDDARTRHHQLNDAVTEAARTLKLSGSLSRVEDKLSHLEKASASANASQEELIASANLVRTNTVCLAFLAAGLSVSLFMHAKQRRTESRTILQPGLLA